MAGAAAVAAGTRQLVLTRFPPPASAAAAGAGAPAPAPPRRGRGPPPPPPPRRYPPLRLPL